MTPDDDRQASLDEVIDSTAADLFKAADDTAIPATPAPSTGDPAAADSAAALPAAFEPPKWTSRWKAEARDALSAFAGIADHKPKFDSLLKQLEDTNGYITKRDQEYADYRKRLDPLYETLAPYEQVYARQGQTLQQGIGQLLEAAKYLASDPDGAFPWFAQTYRPRDAGAVVRHLAQAWGVDPNAALADAPYIDPSVTALVSPLQQQIQSLQQMVFQSQQAQTQGQQSALLKEIAQFEDATDDKGTPLHPYFRDVFDDMVSLVNMGRARSIQDAYDLATRYNPDIQSRTAEAKAEEARRKAVEEASARTEAANKAATASKTVVGKGKASESGAGNLDEAIAQSMKELANA